LNRGFVALDANWEVAESLYRELSLVFPGIIVDARAWQHHKWVRPLQWFVPSTEQISKSCWRLNYRPPPGWFHTFNAISMPILGRSVGRRSEDLLETAPGILILTSPYYLRIARRFTPGLCVYHVLDDYRWYWPRLAARTSNLEASLVESADLIVCVSRFYREVLKRRFPNRADRIKYVSNGVQAEFLASPSDAAVKKIREMLDGVPRPHFCYTGDPVGRADPEMINALAAATSGTIVFAGPEKVPTAFDGQHNVVTLGWLDTGEIRALLDLCDVLIIPQEDTPFNRAGSARKLWEYCASGSPVVGSCLTEIEPSTDGVRVADDVRGFVEASLAMANGGDRQEDRSARLRLAEQRQYPQLAKLFASHIDSVAGSVSNVGIQEIQSDA
jgi:glycosyltransferase involved in cell wall biosynthesis